MMMYTSLSQGDLSASDANAVYDGFYDVTGNGTVNFIDAGRTWVLRD